MIYQPRNVYPMARAIDASVENTFTLEVQTNNSIYAYSLYINDFDNVEKYNSGIKNLPQPLYNGDTLSIVLPANSLTNAVDYKWRVKLYQNTSDMLITYGYVQSATSSSQFIIQQNINVRVGMAISIGNEEKQITSYNVDDGSITIEEAFSTEVSSGTQYKIYSDFIETVPDYIFYARLTPTLSINNLPSVLNTRTFTFNGECSDSTIAYYIYNLYSVSDSGSTLLDTTGTIYSSKLSYTYNSFRAGNSYAIELVVENNLGVIVRTPLINFSVVYDTIEYVEQPRATFDNKTNSINLQWSAPSEHEATITSNASGKEIQANYLVNVPFTNSNSLYTNGSIATWNGGENGLADFPNNWSLSFQFSPTQESFQQNGVNVDKADILIIQENGEQIVLSIDKNNLTINNGERSQPLYTANYVSVNSSSSVSLPTNDYVWLDNTSWGDSGYWVEGGTWLERICNKWWKVMITNNTIEAQKTFE